MSNKKIEEFIDQKLRRSNLSRPREDFQKLLMQKVMSEHKRLAEETKKEKIVKYVLSAFSTFMIGFTVVIGYMYGKGQPGAEADTVERSNTLVGRLVTAVQSVFLSVLEFFGVSISPSTLTIALIIFFVIIIFLIGERLFLRGKYRSSVQMK